MKNWTILVFMVPDKRLEDAARQDLEEMEAAGIPDDVNLAVHIDFETQPQRFVFSGAKATPEKTVDGPTSISASLQDFLAWSRSPQFQAKQHALVLWGHGQGVGTKLSLPGPFGSVAARQRLTSNRSRRVSPAPVPSTSQSIGAGYRVPPQRIAFRVDPKKAAPRALEVTDVASILADHVERRKKRIDILGFDACFMAGIEVASELRNVAQLLVASQDFVPDEGWDYQRFLELIAFSRDGDARRVAEAIVSQVRNAGGLTNLTVMDLAQCPSLGRLAGALNDHLASFPSDKLRVQVLFEGASYLRVRQFIDLRSLCERLVEDFSATKNADDDYVKEAAEATLQKLDPFVIKHAAEPDARRMNGVSVYYQHVRAGSKLANDSSPAEMNVDIDPKEYAGLDFVRASAWGQLLQNLDRRGPRPIGVATHSGTAGASGSM